MLASPDLDNVLLLGRLNDRCDGFGSRDVREERTSGEREMHRAPVVSDMNMLAFNGEVESLIHKYRTTHTPLQASRRVIGNPSITDANLREVNALGCGRLVSKKLTWPFRVTPVSAAFIPAQSRSGRGFNFAATSRSFA